MRREPLQVTTVLIQMGVSRPCKPCALNRVVLILIETTPMDPVMIALDRHLAEDERQARLDAEADLQEVELHVLLQGMAPVCAHNLRIRVEACGDDLHRRRRVLERAWRAA